MIYLLIVHISLGAILLLSVIVRFIAVLLKKIDVSQGRFLVVGSGTALIISGVGLVFITRAPLTGFCLTSLAIVSAIIGYELGLNYLLGKRTVREKIQLDKD